MFSLDKLLVVIVLYKEKLADAAPFKAILDYSNSDVSCYVYDNSPTEDKDAKSYPFVKYVHDPTNPGVSYAYNMGAEYAKLSDKKWLLLFDQDTKVPNTFLATLEEQIASSPQSELYATYLYKEDQLMSPCGYKFKRGSILPAISPGVHSLENISFLNSGLVISLQLFLKAGGYDNNVPLYFSDFVFINRVRRKTSSFTLLDIKLIHDLSSNDMSDITAFKLRYDFYIKGTKEAIMSENEGRFFYYASSLLRAVKLTFTLKDFYYIKSYWKRLQN